MFSLITLVQSLGLAYAAGLNLYATVAITGLAVRYGWVHNVPTTIEGFGNLAVILLAVALYSIEFLATLIPGVASAWETLHSLIRPPAAAMLAAATAWHADPVIVLIAALLGGGLAITTHTTKLGLRYAIDASPEPITNSVANGAEFALVAVVAVAIWHHPLITLFFALVVLAGLIMTVRFIWKALRQVFRGRWMPAAGLMQAPRMREERISRAVPRADLFDDD
ncbi:MAG TPA: DUF4126 domain-containing protein [Gemmatimonadaceae bacterium]|nr:DUF4126 domain-containing protein [Gemmatimonadaceae bacterium]